MIAWKEIILGYCVFTEERLLDKSVLNFLFGHLGSLPRESKYNVLKKTKEENKSSSQELFKLKNFDVSTLN